MKNWKAVRPRANAAWELHDPSQDISEANRVAEPMSSVLKQLVEYTQQAHEPGIEGDPDTWWHTKFAGPAGMHPHELALDLGGGVFSTKYRFMLTR